MRAKWLAWVVVLAGLAAFVRYGGLDVLLNIAGMYAGAPHERYAARLRLGWSSPDRASALWLASAEDAVRNPRRVSVPRRDELAFRADAPDAAAFLVTLRRGQRFVADADVDTAAERAVFVDVFAQRDAALRRIGNAQPGATLLSVEVPADGDYVVRVQPALGPDLRVTLVQRTEPTLRLPVEGATAANVRSSFGAPRDQGRREHEGIDIFASRGTRVLAAADGFVTSVGTNRLGGKVVWVSRPSRGEAHYYAHLDTQLVKTGTRVRAGDVVGTVGNTGNARTTAPHLHFGIYSAGEAVDPLPYLLPARSRGTLPDSEGVQDRRKPRRGAG